MIENKKNNLRPIRSYVLRQGRLTKHQAEAIKKFSDELIIPKSEKIIEHSKLHKGGMNSKHIKNMIKFMKAGDSFNQAHNKAVKEDKLKAKK